jgi:hypothetical protein
MAETKLILRQSCCRADVCRHSHHLLQGQLDTDKAVLVPANKADDKVDARQEMLPASTCDIPASRPDRQRPRRFAAQISALLSTNKSRKRQRKSWCRPKQLPIQPAICQTAGRQSFRCRPDICSSASDKDAADAKASTAKLAPTIPAHCRRRWTIRPTSLYQLQIAQNNRVYVNRQPTTPR